MKKELDEKKELDIDLSMVFGGTLVNANETNKTNITNTQEIYMPVTQHGNGDQIVCGVNISNGSYSSGINPSGGSYADFDKLSKFLNS